MGERTKNMGKLKEKHDHKLTNLLKWFLFACIMCAPFFAVMFQCLYVVNNEAVATAYTGTQQNVFYEAIDQIGTQPIFNWTTGTAMYTTINGMTTGLDFGSGANVLAILLTYWSLNTAVYIIFDIVIWAFTKLTHWME